MSCDSKKDELPDEVLAVLQDRNIELPGEAEALADVVRWYVRDPSASLPVDQFVWSNDESDT